MDEDSYLLLSGIQHFKFCRRQWALIHIEQQWVENYLTAHGRLIHEKADSGVREKRKTTITVRSMPIISHAMKTHGNCDVVEFIQHPDGVAIYGLKGHYKVYPVEYKRGKPKEEDILQLCAQSMCLEEMLCCDIEYGYMFYDTIKRRQQVYFEEALRVEVLSSFKEMHELFRRQHTPKVRKKTACKSCSLVDICMPGLDKTPAVRKYIMEMLES